MAVPLTRIISRGATWKEFETNPSQNSGSSRLRGLAHETVSSVRGELLFPALQDTFASTEPHTLQCTPWWTRAQRGELPGGYCPFLPEGFFDFILHKNSKRICLRAFELYDKRHRLAGLHTAQIHPHSLKNGA